jgi:hypothetical protein
MELEGGPTRLGDRPMSIHLEYEADTRRGTGVVAEVGHPAQNAVAPRREFGIGQVHPPADLRVDLAFRHAGIEVSKNLHACAQQQRGPNLCRSGHRQPFPTESTARDLRTRPSPGF